MKKFLTEDWIIVFAGALILALAIIFPAYMPTMPKTLASAASWLDALYMFAFILVLTLLTSALLRRPVKGIFLSLLGIFLLALAAIIIVSLATQAPEQAVLEEYDAVTKELKNEK